MKHFHAALNRSLKFTGSIRYLLIIVLSLTAKTAISQGDIFVDVTGQQFPGLPQLINSTSGWADYDGDGRPDLLISGLSATNKPVSKLYHNTVKGFVDVSDLVPGLPQVSQGSIAWGDYNKDGKPDFFICGDNGSTYISQLYQNTGNGFVDKSGIVKGLLGFSKSAAAWGNWNNDGFSSLVVIGYAYDSTLSSIRPTTRLYLYERDSLFENTAILPNVPQLANGSVVWADYDHDGLIDLTITGNSGAGSQTRVYHNGQGIYWEDRSSIIPGLPSLANPSLAWVDLNNTGLPDLVMTGELGFNNPVTKVYNNLSSHSFIKQSPGIVAVDSGAVAWGDYDRDGRPDLLISGSVNGTPTTKLYHNTQNGFTDVTSLLPGVPGLAGSAAAWADYDKDGWLDVMITGDMFKTVSGHRYFGALFHNKGGNSGFENRSSELSAIGQKYNMAYGSISWVYEFGFDYYDLLLNGDAETPPNGNAPFSAYFDNYYYVGGKKLSYNVTESSRIPALKNNSMAWADFNKDGKPDLMIIGRGKADNSSTSQLLKQIDGNEANFTDVTNLLPGLPKLNRGSVKWGDYDRDGWPDLAVCGLDDTNTPHTLIYHNNQGNSFTNVSSLFPGLPAVYDGAVAWGDYDGDGRADLLLSGSTPSNTKGKVTMLYHSTAGGFTDQSVLLPDLPQVGNSSVSFADVNNDGLPDILVTGADNTGSSAPHTTLALYYNNVTSITLMEDATLLKGVPGFSYASIASGDYDNDGKTDIFITGRTAKQTTSVLYHNTGHGLEDKSGILPIAAWYIPAPMGVYGGSASFTDYDLDGRDDIFVTGENALSPPYYSSLWRSANTNANYMLRGLQAIAYSSSGWGDYDNDGKPDLFITGLLQDHTYFAKLYHNLGDIFEDKTSLLPGLQPVYDGAVAWGDYDNDGKLDLFVMGNQGTSLGSRLYHNTGSGFTDVSVLLPGLKPLSRGSATWNDYDNDGRLDLLITGVDPDNNEYILLYHNKGNGFEDASPWASGLPSASAGIGSVAWADYNNDGLPDLFISGINLQTGGSVANLYYNTGVGFALDENWVNQFDHIPGLSHSAAAWGDYNNDGWIDLFLSGETSAGVHVTKLMQNSNGRFTDVSTNLPGLPTLSKGSAAWGDFDNDGLRDLVLTGQDANAQPVIRLYHNRNHGLFADVTSQFGAGLQGMLYSSVAVADYDNDGNLDFMVTGDTGAGYSSTLYHNPLSSINTTPAAPSGLSSTVSADNKSVTLTWKGQTPAQGLNYNIYVGTASGGQDVVSPMADLSNGYRRVIQLGNSQTNSYILKNLTPGKRYYWSVQSVDAAYKGSSFAAEQNFAAGIPGDEYTLIDTIFATSQGAGIRIDWNTLHEEPGDWFVAEKQYLNGPFVPITGKIYTQGSPSSYSANDRLALQGKNSYRVKIFDKEGNFTVSDIVTVNIGSNDTCTLKVYPNPVHDLLNVKLDCAGKTKFGGVVSVINQDGKIVMFSYMRGTETKLDLSRLPNGLYYVQYNDGFRSEKRKVIKL